MFKDKIGNKYERMMSYRKWAIMTSSSHLLLISSQLFSCTANEDLGGQNVLLCSKFVTSFAQKSVFIQTCICYLCFKFYKWDGVVSRPHPLSHVSKGLVKIY